MRLPYARKLEKTCFLAQGKHRSFLIMAPTVSCVMLAQILDNFMMISFENGKTLLMVLLSNRMRIVMAQLQYFLQSTISHSSPAAYGISRRDVCDAPRRRKLLCTKEMCLIALGAEKGGWVTE